MGSYLASSTKRYDSHLGRLTTLIKSSVTLSERTLFIIMAIINVTDMMDMFCLCVEDRLFSVGVNIYVNSDVLG